MAELISTNSLVESPFVILKIGNNTFGSYSSKAETNALGTSLDVTYPNCMKSIKVTKINGQVNTYEISIVYAITETDDPNLMEKVFSSIRNSREMTLTYGDWNCPTNIYKNETALITSIKSNVSVASSKITYTILGVSNALSLNSALYDFPAREAKPSDVIKELLYNSTYGLTQVFTGMVNKSNVISNNLIASDDKKVAISALSGASTLNYINHLIQHMASTTNTTDSALNNSIYQMHIVDDVNNTYGGPYFEVKKIDATTRSTEDAAWEIDVGYPGTNLVTGFDVNNDESWALLYDYQDNIDQSKYIYRIDNNGNLITEYSPSIVRSKRYKVTTEKNKNWWTQMTQYPITATLTIKGLIRPTILMDYIKLNVLFYGQKHITSGIYVITKQEDTINEAGYRTVLTILRIKEDSL